MELTKQDTQKAKGIAILGMVMLHLFCRMDNLPYTPWIWIGKVPFVYYLGLFGDLCVPIYCFCSGYAHCLMEEKRGKTYYRGIPGKLLRFLVNYWIVVVLFSGVGLLFGHGDTIPGSLKNFLGNVFLVGMNYNGAWWFVITYIFLSLISPGLIWLSRKLPMILVLIASGLVYFVSYLFRFNYSVELSSAILNWIWQQLILLGTSQFGYMIGVVVRNEKWVSKIRGYLWETADTSKKSAKWKRVGMLLVCVLPIAAFVGHSVIQTLFVAPFTAMTVLLWLFVARLPGWTEQILLLMGKHSTNIWLTHMFFYLTLFEGLVFKAKYPVFIVPVMFVLCICASKIIGIVQNKLIFKG